jgi:endonuclease III
LLKSANERKTEIDGAKGNKDAIAAINAKFDENDKETRRVNSEQKLTELTEELGKGIELMSAANDAFQALSSIGDQRREQELSGLEKENEALDKKKQKDIELLDSQNLTDEQRVAAKNNINKKYFAIEKANFDKMEKIKKEQFESNKKNQIASAIINTASAVVQALGSMPPPASFIMAALAGVAGIAQVIKISETKYEGGTPPELSKITAAASGVKSAGSAIPSSGQINNIKTIPKIQEEGLKYTKVYVTTEDINQVSSKAEVIQNRATK